LITAILFGSAARRCSWENRIFCYQMTVLIEALKLQRFRTIGKCSCTGSFAAAKLVSIMRSMSKTKTLNE
jgi:hypothetical protein